jgi:hypothetical protein
MVQPKYSPEEALNRVKLMMSYDMGKTLNENREIIFEQESLGPSETSNIARKIYKSFMGDVQSSDLQDVIDILTDEVIGKSFEDGTCLLNKVDLYIKKIKSGEFSDYFTTLQGISSWSGEDMENKTLGDLIKMSNEENEPEFIDIKNKLVGLINTERKGFCVTKKTEDNKKEEGKKEVSKGWVKDPTGNKTWEYQVRNCEWIARKIGTTTEYNISKDSKYSSSVNKLESSYPNLLTGCKKPIKDTEKIKKQNTPTPTTDNYDYGTEPDKPKETEANDVLNR